MSIPERELIELNGESVEILDNHCSGEVVFVFHWNSGSAESCAKIFNCEIAARHRIICVSLLGNGGSSASLAPLVDYSLKGIGKFIAKVIARYQLASYWLVGQSVSAHAIIESHQEFQGALGFVSICAPPISIENLSKAFIASEAATFLFDPSLSTASLDLLAKAFTCSVENEARIKSDFVCADPKFRPTLGASLMRGEIEDEWACLAAASFPVLFIKSERDTFIDDSYYLKLVNHPVLSVSDSGHSILLDQPEACAKIILNFMDEVLCQ